MKGLLIMECRSTYLLMLTQKLLFEKPVFKNRCCDYIYMWIVFTPELLWSNKYIYLRYLS